MPTDDLDQVIHQPIRTKIMALLLSRKECDYSTIKNSLNLSDGHMSTHMKVLVGENYVELEKEFVGNKPRTTYRLSKNGKKRFADYVASLRKLIELG